MLKFMYNGIKLEGKLFKGHYSKGTYTERSGIAQGSITIYACDYASFPSIDGLTVKNDTDSMTDYFEKDRIIVEPTNEFYTAVLTAFNAQEAKRIARYNKRMGITEVVEIPVIEEVKTVVAQEVAPTTENNTNTIEVKLNGEKNGVEIYFTEKPVTEIRTEMKSNGFRYNGKINCWYAKQSKETLEYAYSLETPKNVELETIAEVEVVEENEDKMPDANDFNTIETLRDKYITNWTSIPEELQNFILTCDKYWICLQSVELYKDNKIVASIDCSRWEDTIEVNSIGAGELFQWELYRGFTLNNLIVPTKEKVSFDNIEIIETLDKNIFVNCLIPSLNKNNTKESNDIEIKESSSLNKFQVQKIVKLSLEQYDYFIDNLLDNYDFLSKTGGYELDDITNELSFYYGVTVICDNQETIIIDAEGYSYARYCTQLVEDINNSLQAELRTLNTTIIINNELYNEVVNSIKDTELYEIQTNNKTVITDNRYIKNIPCNGLTVITGKTVKELMKESSGIDILNLKVLRLFDNVFKEGLLKHDTGKVFSLFPSQEDKQLQSIKFMDRLNYEIQRATAV